jgi:hypothetical protein
MYSMTDNMMAPQDYYWYWVAERVAKIRSAQGVLEGIV